MAEVRWYHYLGAAVLALALGTGMYCRLQRADKPTGIAARQGAAPSVGPAEDSVPPPRH